MTKKVPQRRPKKGKLHDLKTLSDDGRSRYDPQTRREIAMHYAVTGNGAETAREFGVNPMTICRWKKRDWWHEIQREAQEAIEDQVRAQYNRLANKAAKEALDRLENGDYLWDAKRGEFVRKPVSAMDATKVSAIAYDKRRLSLNQATKITQGDDDQLQRLADKFAQIADKNYRKIRQENSIPGELED